MVERVISVDVETETFGRGNMAPRIVCMSIADGIGSSVHGRDSIERVLRDLLKQACLGEVLICGHVVAYDFACILSNFPDLWDYVWVAYDGNRILCTSIRERLLDIAIGEFRFHVEDAAEKKHGYDLGDLAERRLGIKLDKDKDGWRTRFEQLKKLPLKEWPKDAIEYSRNDAKATLELFRDQDIRARHYAYYMPTQFDDSRADFALRLMSVWGVMTDRTRVQSLTKTTFDRMRSLGRQLSEVGLASYKETVEADLLRGDSEPSIEVHKNNKAIQAAVEAHHPNPPRTEKGNTKIDAETLQDCDFEPFSWLIEFNSLQKTLTTYLRKLVDSPIHASFFAIGAESGRTSCANPNLQNQPRLLGVRECFIPRPGQVFLDADYSTQEMRTLAQSCLTILGHSRLAERFQGDPNFDPHLELARLLAVGNPDSNMAALRQRCKAANFGFPAGMGPDKFCKYARAYDLKLTRNEAEHLRKKWFEGWPEMKRYFDFVSQLVGRDQQGKIKIPQSGFVRAGVGFSDACNSFFQGLASHASKRALWEVTKRCYNRADSFLYGSRPVLFVHDEILLETPVEVGHEAASELTEVMEKAGEFWTPDIPARAEACLMSRWSKDAKPRFDETGRLIPWKEN